jgi:hypothetical protein
VVRFIACLLSTVGSGQSAGDRSDSGAIVLRENLESAPANRTRSINMESNDADGWRREARDAGE